MKTDVNQACDGCGECCRRSPCDLARDYLWENGECAALCWDGFRWRCGLVGNPNPFVRRVVSGVLAIGRGCHRVSFDREEGRTMKNWPKTLWLLSERYGDCDDPLTVEQVEDLCRDLQYDLPESDENSHALTLIEIGNDFAMYEGQVVTDGQFRCARSLVWKIQRDNDNYSIIDFMDLTAP